MDYWCHIWTWSAQFLLSSLDRVQNRLRSLVGDDLFYTLQPLSRRYSIVSVSIIYWYIHGKRWDELYSLVQTFTTSTSHAISKESNQLHFLRISNVRKFYTAFSQEMLLWETDFRVGASLDTTILISSSYLSFLFS